MRRMLATTIPVAAVLLHLTTLAAAHGHDSSIDIDIARPNITGPAHSSFIADDVWNTASYVDLGERSASMLAHVILMILAWLFVLPIGKSSTSTYFRAD
jgi:hypothetical protein